MTGSGSPCGARKFLKRKCVRGCVFAPYFCHEQGATYFPAVHKVFGASNVSKLLAHLPVSGRCEAAITISYEAQARLQDPIYGYVAHIFALQQQVVNLQAQLAYLREQATQGCLNASTAENPDEKYFEKPNTFPQDLQSWFQMENSNMDPQFLPPNLTTNPSTLQYYGNITPIDPTLIGNYENSGMGPQFLPPNLTTNPSTLQYYGNITPMDPNPIGNYENLGTMEERISFSRFEESCNSMSCDMQRQWPFHEVYLQ